MEVEAVSLDGLAPRIALRIKWLEGRVRFWRVATTWALAAVVVLIIAGTLLVSKAASIGGAAGAKAGQEAGAWMGYAIGYKDAGEGRPAAFDRVLERAREMMHAAEQQRANNAGSK